MRTLEYGCGFFTLPKKTNQKSGKSACFILSNGSVTTTGRAVLKDTIGKECGHHYRFITKLLGERITGGGSNVYGLSYCNTPCDDPVSFWLYSFPVREKWCSEASPEIVADSCRKAKLIADAKQLDTMFLPELDESVQKVAMEMLDDRFVMCVFADSEEDSDEEA